MEHTRNAWNVCSTQCMILYMPYCSTCAHPNRDEIDRQLVAGAPLRAISASFNISLGSIHRHKEHVRDMIRERTRDERFEHSSDLLQRVLRLAGEAEGLLQSAKAASNLKAATSAICAAVRVLELCGRLDGSLAQPNAPGLHLTLNRVTNNTIVNYDNDIGFAQMIAEATKNFSPAEIERLKALAQSESRCLPAASVQTL
jgi:hypothetical protein